MTTAQGAVFDEMLTASRRTGIAFDQNRWSVVRSMTDGSAIVSTSGPRSTRQEAESLALFLQSLGVEGTFTIVPHFDFQ